MLSVAKIGGGEGRIGGPISGNDSLSVSRTRP